MEIELCTFAFVPDGWKLKHYYCNGIRFDLDSLGLNQYVSSHQLSDGKITGTELLKEVEKLFPANANLLDFFLENPCKIPAWIKEICPLFFFGTIYEDKTGKLCVRCLCHSVIKGEEKFYWRWRWLSDYWRKNNPVLMRKNPNEGLVW